MERILLYICYFKQSFKELCGCGPMKCGFNPVIPSSFCFSKTRFEMSTNNSKPAGLTNSNNWADFNTSGTNQVTL